MLNIPLPRRLCPGGLLLSALFIAFLPVHAAQATDALPDAHAPIGVMADHMHKKGRIYDFPALYEHADEGQLCR